MNKGYKVLKVILFILYFMIFTKNVYYSLISILVICIHELGHLIFLKFKRVSNFGFKVSVLGFKIDLGSNNLLNNEILAYLFGSLSNIIVGTICYILNIFVSSDYLSNFVIINFVIAFINLIPAFPLDGAMILRSVLLKKYKYNMSMYISVFLSVIIAASMFLFGIFLYFKNGYFNFTFMIISIFIIISIYREYKIFLSTYLIKNIDYKKYVFFKKKYFKTKAVSVYSDIRLFELIKLCRFSKFLIFYFIDDNLNVLGIMNEYNVLECYKKYGNIKVIDYYCKKIN